MNIRFYTTVNEKPKFIKFENRAEIFVGFQFEDKNSTYQVTGLKYINRKKGIIKVFCCELPIYRKATKEIPMLPGIKTINSDPES